MEKFPSEQIPTNENIPVSEQGVIEALNSKETSETESKEILVKYSQQCEAESDAKVASNPDDPHLPNRANIECAFKIAQVLIETEKYKQQGLEALEEAYGMALQTELTADLAKQIDEIIQTKAVSEKLPLDKIMTAEEYSKLEHSTPYLYELKNGEKELLYFGAYHSRNPEDGIFKDIENKFNEVTPDLVLIEGMSNIHQKRESFEKNEMGLGDDEDAIRKKIIDVAGESGFALYLAIKKGIDCESPEPEDADMYNALLEQGFSKDDIFAEQIFLVLPQYHRQTEQSGFKEYTEPFIDSFKKATNWRDFDYSYEYALEAAKKAIGKHVDVENDEQTLDYVDPIPWENKKDAQTVMNQIARATSQYRDKFMVSEIAKALQTHKKVFVVFGASHAVMQEPALKELFKQD